MKRFMTAVAVLAVAGTTYGASLKQGTQEIVVEGFYDPETVSGDATAISIGYGQFIQDLIEVGVEGNYATDEDVETYGLGAFAEYNFDLGTEVVPFVGAGLGWANTDIDDGQSADAVVVSGNVGVKYFLAENVAISADGEVDWSDDEIYVEDGEAKDTNFQLNLGMRFFIP